MAFSEIKTTAQVNNSTSFEAVPETQRSYFVIQVQGSSVSCKTLNMHELCNWISSIDLDGKKYNFDWVLKLYEEPKSNINQVWLSLCQVSSKAANFTGNEPVRVMIIPVGSCLVPTNTIKEITAQFAEVAYAAKEKERSPFPA